MYAEAHFSTSRGIVMPLGSIRRCFRVSVVPNIIMETPGQLRGLMVGWWPNALGVSSDNNYENIANVSTSTLKLKMFMFNISQFFKYRTVICKLKF
jgi:hypothetical protein